MEFGPGVEPRSIIPLRGVNTRQICVVDLNKSGILSVRLLVSGGIKMWSKIDTGSAC